MQRILVGEFLRYFDPKEDRIQVHIEGDGEWENYIEVYCGSPFLKPLMCWYIVSFSAEEDDTDRALPIIRISVSPDSKKVQKGRASDEDQT